MFFSLWALSDIFFTDHSFYHPYIYVYTYSFYLHSTCALSSHLSIFPSFTHPAPLCHSSMPLNLPIYSSSYPPISLFLHWSIHPSYPFTHPSPPPIYPQIYAFNPLCTHPSTGLVYSPISLCVHSFTHLSIFELIYFSCHPYLPLYPLACSFLIHLLIYITYPSIYPRIYLSLHLSSHPSTHPVFQLSTHPFSLISLLTHLSICLSTYLSTHPPT